MSYLIGSGWWMRWYALLWLAVAPYVAMTAALARPAPNDPMPAMETAFALGSVGLFVLMGATAIPVASGRQAARWAAQLIGVGSALALLLFS